MNLNEGSLENPITEVADSKLLNPAPFVSVVMITYNHEKFLAQAIEGVLAQVTDFAIELIIGEDCSTDGTRAVALEFQRRNPGLIRLRFPQRNLGVMPNFIASLKAARGHYIALCEGDDYWCDPRKLEKQVAVLEKSNEFAGVFHDSYRVIDKNESCRIRIGTMKIDPRPDIKSLIRAKHISTASMVFKNFPLTARHIDLLSSVRQGDYMISLIVGEKGRWKYLADPMSVYRIHDGGVWSGDNAINVVTADIKFYEILHNDKIFSKHHRLINQKKANSFRQLAENYAKCGDFGRSMLHFLWSLGRRDELDGQGISARKYWKVFFRELATKIGCADWLRYVLRRFLI